MSVESRRTRTIVQHLRDAGAKNVNMCSSTGGESLFYVDVQVEGKNIFMPRYINLRDLIALNSMQAKDWAMETYEFWVQEAEDWEDETQSRAMKEALGK